MFDMDMDEGAEVGVVFERADGPSALERAAADGDAVNVTALLRTEGIDAEGCARACLAATRHGHVCCLDALLATAEEHNVTRSIVSATTTVRDGWMPRGSTCLMLAAAAGHEQCMRLLLLHEPRMQVLATDSETGRSALCFAAAAGHVRCVAALLEHSPGLQLWPSKGRDGQSPLMLASLQGFTACVEQLLRASERSLPGPPDMELPAVLDYLDAETPPSAVDQVLAVNSDDYNALMLAASNGHASCCRLLLRHAPDQQVAAVSPSGRNALLWAVEGGHASCASLLLQHKPLAQVTHADDRGLTALMAAVRRGDAPCVRLLLGHCPGPQLEAVDPRGWTPLMLAAFHNHPVCVRLLLAASASPHTLVATVDREGWNAAMRAASLGYGRCLRTLLACSPKAQQVDLALSEACQALARSQALGAGTVHTRGQQATKRQRTESAAAALTSLAADRRAGESVPFAGSAPDHCTMLQEGLRDGHRQGAALGNAPRAQSQAQALGWCVELLLSAGARLTAQTSPGDMAVLWPLIRQLATSAEDQMRLNEAMVQLAMAATAGPGSQGARE